MAAAIAAVARAQWPALAAFAFAANQRPDGRLRCLHFDHGADAAALAAEMLALPDDEALFLGVADGSGWRGVIGAELDPALGRAWLRGPLVEPADPVVAPTLARALVRALRDALPPAIVRLDAFPQADEALLCAAYAAEGFEDRLVNHVLQAPAPAVGAAPAWPASVVDSADHPALAQAAAALHAQAFPEGYLTPATLLATRDDTHRLFAVPDPAQADAALGYLYLQDEPEANEGYIDFVAVAPQARGRGVGRALMAAAAHWAFVQRALPRLALTVRSDRAPALALYRACGFAEVAAGRHLCWQRAGV